MGDSLSGSPILRKDGYTNRDLKGGKNMVVDFMGAALPWILLVLFLAISCSFMSKTEK